MQIRHDDLSIVRLGRTRLARTLCAVAFRILSVLVLGLAPGTAWSQLPALSYSSGAGAISDISGFVSGFYPCPTVSYGQLGGGPDRTTGGDGISTTADSNPLNAGGRTETTAASADSKRGHVRAFASADVSSPCAVFQNYIDYAGAGGEAVAQFYDTYTVVSMPATSTVNLQWSFRGTFSALTGGIPGGVYDGGGGAFLVIYLQASPPPQPVAGLPSIGWLVQQIATSDTGRTNSGVCVNNSCPLGPAPTPIVSTGGTIDVAAAFSNATGHALATGDSFIIGVYLAADMRACGSDCGNLRLNFTTDFSASAEVVASGGGVISSTAFKPAVPMAWGDNTWGQLGDGTTIQRSRPVPVSGLADVIDVAAAGSHTIALTRDGAVWAWGLSVNGSLGDGTSDGRYQRTPIQVLGPGGTGTLNDVIAVATSSFEGGLALKRDGTVWAWGAEDNGALGDGNTSGFSGTPVQVVGPGGVGFLTDIVSIAAYAGHSLALKSDGTVWAWGFNAYGQVGDGSTTARSTPVQVVGPGGTGFLTNVIAIAAGQLSSVALKSDSTVWTWGDNSYAELGNGTYTNSSTPVEVVGPGGSGTLSGVVAIAAGALHVLALKSDPTLWAWGADSHDQLGIHGAASQRAPVQVFGSGGTALTGIAAIAGGGEHSLVLKNDGTVQTWGRNAEGQLGDGTTTDSFQPVTVSDLTDVVDVRGGYDYSVALVLANTLVGSPVVTPVDPATGASPVTLTFSNVTNAGMTTVSVSTNGPSPPSGFQLANGLYYDITTTATFSSVEICLDYSGTSLAGTTTQPVLQHYDKTANPPGWVNVTITHWDQANNIICGTVSSLSPFALMQVVDKAPPTVTCSVSPSVLWPPNHQMVPVTAVVNVTDTNSGPAGFTLTSITSSEADNGLGDGDRPHDIQGFIVGTSRTSGQLRAERSGLGGGRIYTLTYTGRDVAGNSATCAATVTVPHDQGARR